MIAFTTLVDDGHVWHRSLDGEPLPGQPNATFAHRTDWFKHCSFCRSVRTLSRFQAKYRVDPNTGCWIWTANKTRRGYGRFFPTGNHGVLAHRWAWEQRHGPVPEGLELDHFVCDTTSCANPDHVRPAAHRENVLRGSSPPAQHAAQTHCKNGHPWTDENISAAGLTRLGARICNVCRREYWVGWYEEHKAEINAKRRAQRAAAS